MTIDDILKALSLSQPWCWAVMDEIVRKWIENRSWQPPISMIGKTIAIHAAKSWDNSPIYRGASGYLMRPYAFLEDYGYKHMPARYDAYPCSAIVGLATIDRIVTKADTLAEDQQKWFFGPFGWVLTDVRKLPREIPIKGKQGLWTVPDAERANIISQLREAA